MAFSLPLIASIGRQRFQNRLLFLVLPVVVAMLAAVVSLAYMATKHRLIMESQNALSVAELNLESWLEVREQRLREAAAALARDFGFRSAIASGDPATTGSALENLRRRISASRLTLIDLDRRVLLDQLADGETAGDLHLPPDADLTDSQLTRSWFVATNQSVRQLTLVPVLAPDPIAWIVVAREIAGADLGTFRRQSTLPIDVTFAEWRGTSWRGISTLTNDARQEFGQLLRSHLADRASERTPKTVQVEQGTFVTVHRRLPAGSGDHEIVSFVQYSVDAALTPYQNLFYFLLAVGAIAIFASTVVLMIVARSLTSPIRSLDDAAQQIRAGNYSTRVDVTTGDELGRLGETFNAMVDAVASREQRILEQSLKDPLTQLPNLLHFGRQTDERAAACRTTGERFSVMLVEVDRVQEVRSTLGHEVADQVMVAVAQRLVTTCKATDLVARMAGPSFALLLDGVTADGLPAIGARIVSALAEPVTVGGINVDLLVRVGLASFPEHGSGAAEILRHAEVAASQASTTQPVVLYDPARDPYRPELLSRIGEIRHGIGRQEFALFLQPKIEVASGRCVAAEALIRWQHPRLGRLAPVEFIPLAERTGVIQELTRWALASAIGRLAEWQARGLHLSIAVNLSAKDLRQPDLSAYVAHHLEQARVAPERLTLEITESAIMDQPEDSLRVLGELRSLGVRLSVDDFGTGYSSLAYLKRLPVTELKVDRSFITNVARDASDQVIVRTTLDLAHDLGLETVAEGVEDAAALGLLTKLGCRYAQGYHIAPPLSAEQFDEFLKSSAFSPRRDVAADGNIRRLFSQAT